MICLTCCFLAFPFVFLSTLRHHPDGIAPSTRCAVRSPAGLDSYSIFMSTLQGLNIFTFVGPNQAELRYIGPHHSIYVYDLVR
jgi:hypothetical protein